MLHIDTGLTLKFKVTNNTRVTIIITVYRNRYYNKSDTNRSDIHSSSRLKKISSVKTTIYIDVLVK